MPRPARAIGINHVALEVGDLDEALAWYGNIVAFDLRGRAALATAGVAILPGRGLNFRDPWGNRVEVVQYDAIQFSKTDAVLSGMGLGGLGKTDAAQRELREKGLADDS